MIVCRRQGHYIISRCVLADPTSHDSQPSELSEGVENIALGITITQKVQAGVAVGWTCE